MDASVVNEDLQRASVDDDSKCILRTTAWRSAKDKRNLREKRRSTGVARYDCTYDTQPGSEDDVDDDEVTNETCRNTSYNETVVTPDESPTHCTPTDRYYRASTTSKFTSLSGTSFIPAIAVGAQQSAITSPGTSLLSSSSTTSVTTCVSAAPQCPTAFETENQSTASFGVSPPPNASVLSGTRTPTSRSIDEEHGRRGPKKSGPPAVPPKPTVRTLPSGTACKPTLHDNEQRAEEQTTLLARVHALEKLMDDANTEKSLLTETLRLREHRIAELQNQVETLNKDLELADGDCEKLEEENRALFRVVAQLSPR